MTNKQRIISTTVGILLVLIALWVGTWAEDFYGKSNNMWPGFPIAITALLMTASGVVLAMCGLSGISPDDP